MTILGTHVTRSRLLITIQGMMVCSMNSRFLMSLAAAFSSVLMGCSSIVESLVTEPKVSFHSVSIRDAKPEGATAVIALNVENPNGISLTVDRLRYTLELAGRSVASAEIEKVATIAAKTTSKVEVPVPFRYDQVFASVLDLMTKGTAAYKVNGEARIGLFNLPFDHKGDLKIRD